MPLQSQLIEHNLYQYYYYLSEKNNLKLFRSDTMSWINDSPVAFLNKIFALPQHVQSVYVNDISQAIRDKKSPQYVMFNDQEVSTDFEEALLQNDYQFVTKWPGMLMELHKTFKQTRNRDIDFRIAQNIKDLKDWLTIIETGLFNNQEKLEISFFEKLLYDSKIRFHLGYYKQNPVTGIMSFNSDQICGLYLLATLPEYRRMGIADAIMKDAIDNGFEQGMKYSTLQATEAGYKIYQRIGFCEFCQIKVFRLSAK